MIRRSPPLLALLATVLVAAPATAEQFDVTGTHSRRGAFSGRLDLERRSNGDLFLSLQIARPGREPAVASGPVLERLGGHLKATLFSAAGISGRLGSDPAAETRLELDLAPDAHSVRFTIIDAEGVGRGEGRKAAETVPIIVPAEEGDDLVGRLVAVNERRSRQVRETRPADFERELDIAGFLHVGVAADVAQLTDRDLTVEQRQAIAGRDGRWAWIASKVQGGATIDVGAAIPLGGAGRAEVGLEAGGALSYEVVDLLQVPTGLNDWRSALQQLRDTARRVFTLPLTADEALAHPLGAERTFEGMFTVAVSGTLGVGHETSVLNETVEVGAAAHVGGFYRLRQNLKLELHRLEGTSVRVRLQKGRSHAFGAEARAFLGLAMAPAEGTSLERPAELGAVEYLEPVKDEDGRVGSYLCFELGVSASEERSNGMDMSYRFDLSQPRARAAYERAVRGDMIDAAAAAAEQGTGVTLEFRIFDRERKTYTASELTVSELYSTSARRRVTARELLVRDRAGETLYSILRIQRKRSVGGLAALFTGGKVEETMLFELLRADRRDDALTSRSLRYRLERSDGSTSLAEVQRLRRILRSWGMNGLDEASLPTPGWRLFSSRYGETSQRIAVDLGEAGLNAVFQRSKADLEKAYLDAAVISGDAFVGTYSAFVVMAAGRQFATAVAALGDEPDGELRARGLAELVRRSGWDITPISALVRLCPPQFVRIQAAIAGERIDYDAERRGGLFDAPLAELHGQ
jgi:hypothetical protein